MTGFAILEPSAARGTMKPAVRLAVEADAALLSTLNADVQALHAESLPWLFKPPGPETFTPADASALLAKPDNLIFVAEVGSEAAGYAYAEIVRRAETPLRYAFEEVHLHHIGVRPAWRRQGVGEALIDAVREAANQRAIVLLTLSVWSFNDVARTFFQELGFVPYMERMWCLRRGA
jgi:ribosomal protein S18 acetylase RimI-like enzyme